MAMFDSNIDYTKFIQFNGGTLRVATFVEIRDALVRRHKEIFGNDIDTSTASADGQFITEIALILNNIVNTFSYAFDSLDPAVATGKYLDILCSYNNVYRINKSASTVELYIFNSSPVGSMPEKPAFLLFTDRSGQTWKWINPQDANGVYLYEFPAQEATLIKEVECEYMGAISAQGSKFIDKNDPTHTTFTDNVDDNDWDQQCPGWIYQLVDVSPLRVWQCTDAIIGNEDENDESLRSRRTQLLGNKSVSVLEGLQGSLLNISGIKDVFIINNPKGTNEPLSDPVNDGTTVLGHSIYVALRYKEGVNLEPSMIGKLIYNKLTPGIGTTPLHYDGAVHENHPGFKKYVIQKTDQIFYTIYWKQCQAIKPVISIKMLCGSNYDFPADLTSNEATTDVEKNIVQNLQTYIDNVGIDTYLQTSALLNVVQQSDRQKQGVSTFFVQTGSIGSTPAVQNYPAGLNYFKYDDSDYKFAYVGNTCTITIG